MRYLQLGKIPPKRHTIFKSEDDRFYYEQLFGTEGFHGISSLLYHIHRPTQIRQIGEPVDVTPKVAVSKNVTPRMFKGKNVTPEQDYLASRKVLMLNSDLHMGLAKPQQSTDYFYKNAECDELLYVHHGSGVLKTFLGTITFNVGDYLVIPRGTIYQIFFDAEDTAFTWAPRPRGGAGHRRQQDGARGGHRRPRADAPQGEAAPQGDGPRQNRRRDGAAGGEAGAPQGERTDRGPRKDFRGKPGGKPGEDRGERGDKRPRGGKPEGKGDRGDRAPREGAKTYTARPPRAEKPVDPDSPFAVLAALKNRT